MKQFEDMKLLILGSKEYPVGTNTGEDPIPSGGIEVYVEQFAEELLKNKEHAVKIISRRFKGSNGFEQTDNLYIYRVPWIKGFFLRNATFNFMTFLKALRIDFDIVHANGPIATFFGLILSKIKKTPIIATPHGLALEQPQYNRMIKEIFSVLEKIAYSKASYVVFSSEQEKESFKRKLDFLPKKYRVIHPGIDAERFKTGNAEKIKKEFSVGTRKVITSIGRLIDVKGLRYLIRALADLKGDFLLLIVGDGPQRRELEALVSKSNIEHIVFTGQRTDISDILSATDIFVLPSLSEGLPLVLLEAMAAGKACVVTDIGLPVVNGLDALVVKAGDVKDLRAALVKLLDNEELRKELGKKAEKKAVEDYSWIKTVEDYSSLFDEIVPAAI